MICFVFELSNSYMAVYPFVPKLYRNKCKPVRNKDGKVVECVLRVTGNRSVATSLRDATL